MKWRSRGRFKRRVVRRGRGFEIAQTNLLITVTIANSSTREVPSIFDVHLFSQYGLSKTIDLPGAGTVGTVVDAARKGISLAWSSHQLTFGAAMDVRDDMPFVIVAAAIPYAFAVYKDEMVAPAIEDTTQIVTPAHAANFNLFSSQVGSQIFGILETGTQSGAFSELFAFPQRILHRESGIRQQYFGDGGIPTEAFMTGNSAPDNFIRRRFKTRRCFLADTEGLFIRFQSAGSNAVSEPIPTFNMALLLESVYCYKAR